MTMNETLDPHRSTNAFRDYLEGEVIHEYRRRRTFRRLRAAAVIVVSVGVGMTTTLASAQVRENARKDSILEAARSEVMLAETRLALARTQLADEQKLVSLGAHSSNALAAAELQLYAAEHAMAIATLNTRETEMTGLPPRDGLNSPVVWKTDFMKQRLQAKAMLADRQLQIAERLRAEARQREDLGVTTQADVMEQELEVIKARKALAVVAAQMKARDDFLQKKASVEELMQRVDRVTTQQSMMVASKSLEVAKAALSLAEQKHAVGVVGDVEVLRAKLAVAERQLELQRLSERMRLIK